MLIVGFIIFIFGTVIGSFLNVVIDRIPQGRSLLGGRSTCDSCHKKLEPNELIPIISYIYLQGHCKSCHAKIPARLTLVEILTGAFFILAYFIFQPPAYPLYVLFFALFVLSSNIAIFFIDLEYGIIPDELIVLLTLVSITYLAFVAPQELIIHIETGIFSFLLFLILFLGTRGRGMGLGDVKFAFVIGLILGFPAIIVSLYVAFLTGALVSIILILYGKKHIKSTIPFGPFLVAGTLFAFFFSREASQIFLRIFGF